MSLSTENKFAQKVLNNPGQPHVYTLGGLPIIEVTAHTENGEPVLSSRYAGRPVRTDQRGAFSRHGFDTPANRAWVRAQIHRATYHARKMLAA